jgi:hypothetical protein
MIILNIWKNMFQTTNQFNIHGNRDVPNGTLAPGAAEFFGDPS